MTQYARSNDAEGLAALGICESLLLTLTDQKIISEQDARDLLTDVASTHAEAATTSLTPANHRAVIELPPRRDRVAIKDLYAKVQEYFARNERLEERVNALEAQLVGSAVQRRQ